MICQKKKKKMAYQDSKVINVYLSWKYALRMILQKIQVKYTSFVDIFMHRFSHSSEIYALLL